MCDPGGGTGGSGQPGPTCRTPLWDAAPGGKPKAVCAEGMGGPGAEDGGELVRQ